jgi:diguanylate cyclase (GGDEF)-like protein
MKIGDSKPARDVGSVQRAGSRPPAGQGASSAAQRASDSVEVLGIPANEFTPKVQQAIMTLMAEVEKLRRELQQTQARIADLEQLADQDPLAPIANRRAFVRELSRMLSFAERYSTPSSIVYFDVNGLKIINDTYGHSAGDAVLSQVANTLTKNVRDSDFVARLGGDEFGVILTYTDADTAKAKADSLAHLISEQATPWKEHILRVSVAYGVYSFKGGEDVAHALEAADKAMYAHKRSKAPART